MNGTVDLRWVQGTRPGGHRCGTGNGEEEKREAGIWWDSLTTYIGIEKILHVSFCLWLSSLLAESRHGYSHIDFSSAQGLKGMSRGISSK